MCLDNCCVSWKKGLPQNVRTFCIDPLKLKSASFSIVCVFESCFRTLASFRIVVFFLIQTEIKRFFFRGGGGVGGGGGVCSVGADRTGN